MLLKKAWLHLIINKLSEGCFQFSKFISNPQRFFSNPEKKIPPFLHFKIPFHQLTFQKTIFAHVILMRSIGNASIYYAKV